MKKVDLKALKKIDSPLAKYNAAGQLFCVLCNQPVKSEMFWTGHINGRGHRENLQVLKSKKRPQEASSADEDTPPTKKLAIEAATASESQSSTSHLFKTPFPVSASPNSAHALAKIKQTASVNGNHGVLKPNVAATTLVSIVNLRQLAEDEEEEEEESNAMEVEDPKPTTSKVSNGTVLPEGFFDDPKLDAKARGLEYRNPEEIEWENFVKEIATEEVKSSTMRVVDEEESTVARELDEIEEQMTHWQRVLELERKAEELKKRKLEVQKSMEADEEDEEDEIYDEELDWRSKRH